MFSICCLEGQYNADDRGAGDVDDGMELELLDGGKGQDEEDQLLEIKEIQQGTGLLSMWNMETCTTLMPAAAMRPVTAGRSP